MGDANEEMNEVTIKQILNDRYMDIWSMCSIAIPLMAFIRSVFVEMACIRSIIVEMAFIRSIFVEMAFIRSIFVEMACIRPVFVEMALFD